MGEFGNQGKVLSVGALANPLVYRLRLLSTRRRGYLPAALPFGQYQIILLASRGTCQNSLFAQNDYMKVELANDLLIASSTF